MAQRIQIRRGSAIEWTIANPILAEGEMGLETDTGQFKIGNGILPWLQLISVNAALLSTSGDSECIQWMNL